MVCTTHKKTSLDLSLHKGYSIRITARSFTSSDSNEGHVPRRDEVREERHQLYCHEGGSLEVEKSVEEKEGFQGTLQTNLQSLKRRGRRV